MFDYEVWILFDELYDIVFVIDWIGIGFIGWWVDVEGIFFDDWVVLVVCYGLDMG